MVLVAASLSPLLAQGLMRALEADRSLRPVQASGLEDASGGLQVLVVDEGMGLERAGAAGSQPRIVVVADRPTRLLTSLLYPLGIDCVPATASPEVLCAAVRVAVRSTRLTERQALVLAGIRLRRSYWEIGAELGISVSTVRRHASGIFRALGVKGKHELCFSDV